MSRNRCGKSKSLKSNSGNSGSGGSNSGNSNSGNSNSGNSNSGNSNSGKSGAVYAPLVFKVVTGSGQGQGGLNLSLAKFGTRANFLIHVGVTKCGESAPPKCVSGAGKSEQSTGVAGVQVNQVESESQREQK